MIQLIYSCWWFSDHRNRNVLYRKQCTHHFCTIFSSAPLSHLFRTFSAPSLSHLFRISLHLFRTISALLPYFFFEKVQTSNFNLFDQYRSGAPKKVEDEELDQLLQENLCQTRKELAEQLGIIQQAISHRLQKLGRITEDC